MRNRPLEEGQRWLRQAQEDLRWSRHLAEQGAYHLACFLSQQVAEKAVRAFLYAQGEDLIVSHSVERLCAAATFYEPEFRTRGRAWTILDTYYIATRYPDGLPDGIPADVYTQHAAETAVDLASEVVDLVARLVSGSNRSS